MIGCKQFVRKVLPDSAVLCTTLATAALAMAPRMARLMVPVGIALAIDVVQLIFGGGEGGSKKDTMRGGKQPRRRGS